MITDPFLNQVILASVLILLVAGIFFACFRTDWIDRFDEHVKSKEFSRQAMPVVMPVVSAFAAVFKPIRDGWRRLFSPKIKSE